MKTETVMKVTTKVLEIIQQHRSDTFYLSVNTVSPSAIMFSYGSTDEFRAMISELEEVFGIEIESDDIGDLTVRAFMDVVIKIVGGAEINESVHV